MVTDWKTILASRPTSVLIQTLARGARDPEEQAATAAEIDRRVPRPTTTATTPCWCPECTYNRIH